MTNPAVRAIDLESFATYRNPSSYYADWKGFYESALRRRIDVLAQFEHDVDVKYGPSPYHILNVYYRSGIRGAPVLVYFHGGRWREGHPALYDHLGKPWVESGAVFVSCGYRLCPEYTIAHAADDAVTAIEWVARNVERYGGHPAGLSVAGHSSGGHLAAMATLTDWSAAPARIGSAVRALVCMSAPVDLPELGYTGGAIEALSPVRRISRVPANVVVSYGDPEPNRRGEDERRLTRQGEQLVRALTEVGKRPVTVRLTDVDHVATAEAFSRPNSALYSRAFTAVFGPAQAQST